MSLLEGAKHTLPTYLPDAKFECRERLGGMLRDYDRDAAPPSNPGNHQRSRRNRWALITSQTQTSA